MSVQYQSIEPPLFLAHLVRHFWVLEGRATLALPFRHRASADVCTELIFYYKGGFEVIEDGAQISRCDGGRFFGQTKKYRSFLTSADFGMIGVYLYPGALNALFGIPSSAITDTYTSVDDLLGKDGAILTDKINSATGAVQRVSIISSYFRRRLEKTEIDNNIISQLKAIIDTSGLSIIPDQFGLSRRQYERKFLEYSGMSPHAFISLTRFNALMRSKIEKGKLTQLAYEYGYYDQSHFIREFKRFSGYTPSYYFKSINTAEPRAASELIQ